MNSAVPATAHRKLYRLALSMVARAPLDKRYVLLVDCARTGHCSCYRAHGDALVCPSPNFAQPPSGAYRRVLWAALGINGLMFIVELLGGAQAGSSALQADALDFLADTANYGISLLVLGAAMHLRARAAMLKGLSMGAFGLWVFVRAAIIAFGDQVPEAHVMGIVFALALVANLTVAVLLFRYRAGDSNMRSVWLCTRNDAAGNVAVLAAASGVFATGRGWPDALVALTMAVLALRASVQIVAQARGELRALVPRT